MYLKLTEYRLHTVLQDNLLLCYELYRAGDDIRNIDYMYIVRFLTGLSTREISMLWSTSISQDFVSDLDMVHFLCYWLLPKLEDLEWYESCSDIVKTIETAELYLSDFPPDLLK